MNMGCMLGHFDNTVTLTYIPVHAEIHRIKPLTKAENSVLVFLLLDVS